MGVKKQFSITVEFQTINVEEMMEIEKSQFGKHYVCQTVSAKNH